MSNNSLLYSTNALNVKSLFFNKRVSVYVEGKEDILFWDKIFCSIYSHNTHIEDTNGIEGLKDYMDKIIDEDAQIIVACDNDHTPFLKEHKYISPRIVKTYGYSIENTMYCINNINVATKRYSKTRKDFKNDIVNWYQMFCDQCSVLLYYDIANQRFTKKTKVLGDKCSRFLPTNDSPLPSREKITKYIDSIKGEFSDTEIEECVKLVESDKRELRFLIKGHFLTNAVMNIIKQIVKRETGENISINLDSFYSLTINCIVSCSDKCIDMNTLHERVQLSLHSLNNN